MSPMGSFNPSRTTGLKVEAFQRGKRQMAKIGKRTRKDLEKVSDETARPLPDAVAKVQSFAKTKFDQTVDMCIHLGIDPKQDDQRVRGSVSLPHGTGKPKRVVAFCTPDKVEGAKAAGAIEAGSEDLIKKIAGGWLQFDIAVASPDMMPKVGKLGRQLGPRGLMPSPKAGTVTPDIDTAIKEYAAGKVNFKTDDGGNVHAPIGKLSFSAEQLVENAEHLIDTVVKLKPSAVKGNYLKKISLSGTMTPGVEALAAQA
jgi:large subunit ribosomal protein L1